MSTTINILEELDVYDLEFTKAFAMALGISLEEVEEMNLFQQKRKLENYFGELQRNPEKAYSIGSEEEKN